MKTFAERLAGLRQEAGLSQKVLAELVGVNRSQISRRRDNHVRRHSPPTHFSHTP